MIVRNSETGPILIIIWTADRKPELLTFKKRAGQNSGSLIILL